MASRVRWSVQGETSARAKWRSISRTTRAQCLADSEDPSRSPPPPLPDGYKIGEKIYFTGVSYTLNNGDIVVYGDHGEVMGPETGESREGQLAIKFPQIKTTIAVSIVCHASPPIPGGYVLGDKVYYIAENYRFNNGDRLVHGEQGRVMEPAKGVPKGRVLVDFPNNKQGAPIPPIQLSKPPPLPGGYKIGEKLYFIGQAIHSITVTS